MRRMCKTLVLLCCGVIGLPAAGGSQPLERDLHLTHQRQTRSVLTDWLGGVFGEGKFRKSYALVVGLSDYTGGWDTLESPYHDALRVSGYLIENAGFDYVVTLTNREATRARINRYMEEIFPDLVGERDRFLFYYSGHGTQRKLGSRIRGYLPMLDSGKRSWSNMISMDDVERWNENLFDARHVLFVMDCCFSGLAGAQRKADRQQLYIDDLADYGHHIITAGSADQVSYGSLSRWGGSLFTDSFLRGASGRADSRSEDFPKDGVISLNELTEYIKKRIKLEAERDNQVNQSPQVADLPDSEGEFFFFADDFRPGKAIRSRGATTAGSTERKGGDTRVAVSYLPSTRAQSSDLDLSDWLRLTVTSVDFLPPISDGVGDPDFRLYITANNDVALFGQRVYTGQASPSIPFKLRGAKKVSVSLVEDDGIWGSEDITDSKEVSIQQLLSTSRVTLPILNSVFRKYSLSDLHRRPINVDYLLANFDPEGASGGNAVASAPLDLPVNVLHVDTVAFNAGDATDYIRIPARGGQCTGILWATSDTRKLLEVVAPRGDASATEVFREETERVAVLIRGDGADMLLRFHAGDLGRRTDYLLYAFAGADSVAGFQQFLTTWFESQFGDAFSAYSFRWSGAHEARFGEVIARLRKVFNVPHGQLFSVLAPFISGEETTQFTHAVQVLEAELSAYERARARMSGVPGPVSDIVTVLRAEKGQLADRTRLTAALSTESDQVLRRAIRAVENLGDEAYAEQVLNQFLLDDRDDISGAARDVLMSFK